MMLRREIIPAVIAIAVCELAGIFGSIFTVSAISGWYAYLVRPELSPPSWVFGPVWTTLYALMGVAAYLVWKRGVARRDVRAALKLFALQLVLNALWSLVFFGMRAPDAAFAEIIALWCVIFATMLAFRRISMLAVALLVPYLAWVSFAAYLNYMIWVLN